MKKLLLFTFILLCMNAYSQNIACGYYHSLSICADSTAQAWGNNSRGQLGNGTVAYSNLPVSVLSLSDIVKIDGGFYYTMALKNNGTVWTWGDNYSGQLGSGTNLDSNQAAQVTSISNAISIAAGAHHATALKADSTVWTWGSNGSGQLGTGNTTPSSVPIQTIGLDSVVAIAAGDDHTLALRSDSTVWAWGSNDQGQLGMGSTIPWNFTSPVQVLNLTGVVAIAGSGYKNSYALKADGTVWAWGYNQWGQLGNGTNTQSSVPVQVSNLSGITSIAVHGGQGHMLALKNDGTVWSWGYNNSGQLGDSTSTDKNVPVQVNGLTNILAIACGHNFSLAHKSDGTVLGWGDNQHGQLGIGTFAGTYNTPVQVTSICSMPISVNELVEKNLISIYPNPTSGKLWIITNDNKEWKNSNLEIYNSSGALIKNLKLTGSVLEVNLASYPKGLYFIKISDGTQFYSKRVVID